MAKYAELAVIKSKMLNLVSDVNYLNICFQIQPDGINTSQVGHFTIAVRNELFKNADAMVNYAEIDGKTCMRLVTANYDLNTKHIDQLFSDIESNANKLLTNYN
jgi:glutamate/tyrosine decarboxylase-like PLP-dependent enzyme